MSLLYDDDSHNHNNHISWFKGSSGPTAATSLRNGTERNSLWRQVCTITFSYYSQLKRLLWFCKLYNSIYLHAGGYASAYGTYGFLKSKYFSGDKCVMFRYKMKYCSLRVYIDFPSSSERKTITLFSSSTSMSSWRLVAVTVPTSSIRHRVSRETSLTFFIFIYILCVSSCSLLGIFLNGNREKEMYRI